MQTSPIFPASPFWTRSAGRGGGLDKATVRPSTVIALGRQHDGEAVSHRREHPLVLRSLRNATEQLLEDDARDGDLPVALEEGGDSVSESRFPLSLPAPPEDRRGDAGVEQDHDRRRAFL